MPQHRPSIVPTRNRTRYMYLHQITRRAHRGAAQPAPLHSRHPELHAMRAAVLLLLAMASGGECKRSGRGPASCQGRCACMTFRAHASLKRMQVMAETCATSAESGIVDRSELDDATTAASSAVESIREMRATCAAACARGCRGCRVSRLLNQTKALQEGVDEVVEMGTFVDDE
eukprot:scaffold59693_cov63-Phaeocystis_antarctica.AAC.2